MSRTCVVLGGGGHAKGVVDILLREGKVRPVAVTDSRRKKGGVLGVPIVGDDGALPGLRKKGTRAFIVGVAGVPDNRPRAAVFRKGVVAGLTPVTAIHPSASVARSASLGPGTVVMAQAAINPDSVIGDNVIVNTRAVVEHDVRIADHAHVCPGAVLCGGVVVGEGAFVGAGAVVIQGVRIGAWAVVGAGATVIRDVPDGGCVVGVPARSMGKKGR
jgi:UDP-perosamine 4-acetyltransferase